MTRRFNVTEQDVKRWRRLSRLALDAAANVSAPHGDLVNAARKAERAAAPDREAQLAHFSPLIRLSALWATMPDAARVLNADLLEGHARAVERALDLTPHAPKGAAAPTVAEAEARPERKDIFG